jgi:hypothetical protein
MQGPVGGFHERGTKRQQRLEVIHKDKIRFDYELSNNYIVG